MVYTARNADGSGDLPLSIQKALGMGAAIPATAPSLTIVLQGGDSLTVQTGGDIAIYRPVGFDYYLFACGCGGEIVNEIPRRAYLCVAFNLNGAVHRIYRYKDTYYDFPGTGDKFIEFKPYIQADRRSNEELERDNNCDDNHNAPVWIPREYREVTEKQDLIPDQRKPRERKRT